MMDKIGKNLIESIFMITMIRKKIIFQLCTGKLEIDKLLGNDRG
jgi:hypothetical protein